MRALTGRFVLVLALAPLLGAGAVAHAQAPAFPGAQGGGAIAQGGRGGAVIEVTNLNDSGPGSLRACVSASGPRTCVFRVGGTINLKSGLWIDRPYLTVAGQTAPGGGIQLVAKDTTQSAVMIATNDVIWQYTKIRHGYVSGGTDHASNIVLFSGAANVIVDHNSVAWNQDEGIGVWRGQSGEVKNITLSYNIIADALADHPTALITGAESRALADGMTDIDIHHNLTLNTNHRNPLIKSKSGRIVNNLWYNHRFYYMQFGGGATYDIIGNVFKRGPLHGGVYPAIREVTAYEGGGATAAGSPSLYLSGNTGFSQPDEGGDQWLLTQQVASENGAIVGALPSTFRRSTALQATLFPIRAESAGTLEASLLPIVGASRRLGCDGRWVSNRDATDARSIHQYVHNAGPSALAARESDAGGIPTIDAGNPCPDSDRDGMFDAWEAAAGLQSTNPADRNGDRDGDGHTNLEEFLNPQANTGSGGDPAACQATFTSASAIPAGYAAMYDVFSSARISLFSATCENNTAALAIGDPQNQNNMLVYRKGYRYTGSGWQEFALNGTLLAGSTEWLTKRGTARVALNSGSAGTYLVAYTCQYVSGAWKCGCRDSACIGNYWQLQEYRQQ